MPRSHTAAWALLWSMVVVYALIFSVAAVYKFHTFRMGFDLGVHEQLLWNTTHGRIAAVSMFGATRSYLGIDIILVELLFTPLYALLPRTETMLVLQVVIAATGAVPLFLLARERSGSLLFGLLGALLYFAALPVQYAILYEFQIRTVGTVCFLWAFFFFERQRFWPFLLAGLLAIGTRSDAGFALAAIGLYAALHRRPWQWSLVPLVVGLGWVWLCMQVLIPAFRDDAGFQYGFIYSWLGDTPTAMLQTLLTRPGYVAEHVLTPGKLAYLWELFVPLLFLPLLRPDILLIALPALALNLLSPDRIHWSIRYHYQAFVLPFLLIAALYVVIDLTNATPRWRMTAGRTLAVLLVVMAFGSQLWLRTPLIHQVTTPPDQQRIAAAHEVMALVPPDAPLSVTSTLGPHMARRRELYFFPGGGLIYPTEFVERGEYLLVDLHEVPPEYADWLQAMRQGEQWRTLTEQHDFVLLKRETP